MPHSTSIDSAQRQLLIKKDFILNLSLQTLSSLGAVFDLFQFVRYISQSKDTKSLQGPDLFM